MTFGPTFADELRAAGVLSKVAGWRSDGTVILSDDATDADRALVDAAVAKHDASAVPKPVLTGASLLDVLSDTEAAATGVRPRDLLRLAARSADVVPANNPKLARILAKAAAVTPGLTYEALLARLPGAT